MEVSGELHAPAALLPGKEPPRTHWIGGWGGPESRSGRGGEEKNVTGFIPKLQSRGPAITSMYENNLT
jgi:hypothetical protein